MMRIWVRSLPRCGGADKYAEMVAIPRQRPAQAAPFHHLHGM